VGHCEAGSGARSWWRKKDGAMTPRRNWGPGRRWRRRALGPTTRRTGGRRHGGRRARGGEECGVGSILERSEDRTQRKALGAPDRRSVQASRLHVAKESSLAWSGQQRGRVGNTAAVSAEVGA
jgi:hypothetical protein